MSASETNLANFTAAVIEARQLWVLSAGDEYVVVDSIEFENTDVMPLFSAQANAQALCVEDWSEYKAVAVAIDDFFDEWLPSLDEDGVLVGIDWNADLTGEETDPFTLAKLLADKEA
ncbi:DUF2750 domain-containing protein [Ferrimonas lipolytica]|uniref:DUF2750 domain-containing protein n=1 Tax=Ferrimonas lipolytica TaxID=2724191 RepID=A0A6H1UDT9_9GAMM|nr:DUF2750 domain-containing protein [Ferrimonas lipolytica]QIZ76503.1 DUF2750 domain-containing protein [Ferrimonas lipolytica]